MILPARLRPGPRSTEVLVHPELGPVDQLPGQLQTVELLTTAPADQVVDHDPHQLLDVAEDGDRDHRRIDVLVLGIKQRFTPGVRPSNRALSIPSEHPYISTSCLGS